MDRGESSDDVDGSGESSKKNGRMKLTMNRDTVGPGGRVNRCSVFPELAHVTLIKIS